MPEIRYPDGILIDVGWYSYKNCYCVIVVSSNDADGWRSPAAKIDVADKSLLCKVIQDTIIKYRT